MWSPVSSKAGVSILPESPLSEFISMFQAAQAREMGKHMLRVWKSRVGAARRLSGTSDAHSVNSNDDEDEDESNNSLSSSGINDANIEYSCRDKLKVQSSFTSLITKSHYCFL